MSDPMHIVPKSPYPCPGCGGNDCPVAVYELSVVRRCGHTHEIPPVHSGRPGSCRACQLLEERK